MNFSRQFRLLIVLVSGMIAGTFLYRYSVDRPSSAYPPVTVSKFHKLETEPAYIRSYNVRDKAADVVQMHQIADGGGPLVGAIKSDIEKKDESKKESSDIKISPPLIAVQTTTTTTKKPTTAKPTIAITTMKPTTIPAVPAAPTGGDNDNLPVPRIVHYAWYSTSKLVFRFHHFISVLSAYKHVKPKKIMFWHEIEPQGPWWMEIRNRVPVIELKYRKAPTEIFGKKVEVPEHQSDVVRLEAVMNYGGIYTDLDVIITKSMDPLRKYNTTMGYETPGGLCNGIIISAPNAPFLKIWHETYKTFNDAQWAYHSVQLPATLAKQHANLIHTESDTLHRPNWIEKDWLYQKGKIWDWSKNYAVHLWYRFHNVDHNPEDIKTLDTTMGQLFRYTYYDKKEMITT